MSTTPQTSTKTRKTLGNLLHLKQQDRIGWIGLGQMGYYMARNLQGYLSSRSLTMNVWNRSPAKSAKMHNHGARESKTIEDLVANSNIIFTSLANDAAVEEIYEILIDLAGQVDHSIIFVETSTIYPALATKLKERLAVTPQHTYLQCPVFGRPSVAKAAKLIWVTSGDEKAIKKLCLYFTTMSKSIIHLKTTDVARACSFKLVGNFFVVGTMELLAEGLTLAEKADVDQEHVLKFIEAFFPTPSWTEYSKKMIPSINSNNKKSSSKDKSTKDKDKEPGFSVELGLKDVGHMRQLALDTGASLPTADLAYNHLMAVKEQGKGDQDWSAMIGSLRIATPTPSARTSSEISTSSKADEDGGFARKSEEENDDDVDSEIDARSEKTARPPAYESN
ncbi:NAD binding domain of 6-phosphogluconate dehydrogenase-domain-containing protein [Linnemannia elongata]|nr:NAD binding domain of 6-phosphogluconate dehydrogenase-domain-containing protein [Linnemannia elongata]